MGLIMSLLTILHTRYIYTKTYIYSEGIKIYVTKQFTKVQVLFKEFHLFYQSPFTFTFIII